MLQFQESPIGTLVDFLWLNRPDAKYRDEGEYKVPLQLAGAEAGAFRVSIEKAADEDFNTFMRSSGKPAVERRLWSRSMPFRTETDDALTFLFVQDAVRIDPQTAERVPVVIGLFDRAGAEMRARVFSGSRGRVRYALDTVPVEATRTFVVRLVFTDVQITCLADRQHNRTLGWAGFSAIE